MRNVHRLGVERDLARAHAGNRDEIAAVVNFHEQVFALLSTHQYLLLRFGNGAKANDRVIGAAIVLTTDIGKREAQIDEAVRIEHKRRVVKNIEDGAGNQMRLAMSALTRPRMQRQL